MFTLPFSEGGIGVTAKWLSDARYTDFPGALPAGIRWWAGLCVVIGSDRNADVFVGVLADARGFLGSSFPLS